MRFAEKKRPSETLSLELVPAALVVPHEQVDDKRVARLMNRLEEDGLLVNPPLPLFGMGNMWCWTGPRAPPPSSV
ncbi:MAG: hypothetical protein M5U34_40070 [Chloroflexi bacterium]|nr:hypothetical protein [Chloroflexota bacterium]